MFYLILFFKHMVIEGKKRRLFQSIKTFQENGDLRKDQ